MPSLHLMLHLFDESPSVNPYHCCAVLSFEHRGKGNKLPLCFHSKASFNILSKMLYAEDVIGMFQVILC